MCIDKNSALHEGVGQFGALTCVNPLYMIGPIHQINPQGLLHDGVKAIPCNPYLNVL